jgi:hypothetical protein
MLPLVGARDSICNAKALLDTNTAKQQFLVTLLRNWLM